MTDVRPAGYFDDTETLHAPAILAQINRSNSNDLAHWACTYPEQPWDSWTVIDLRCVPCLIKTQTDLQHGLAEALLDTPDGWHYLAQIRQAITERIAGGVA